MENKKHSDCFVCKSPELKGLKGYEKHNLVKCGSCGFVFMEHIPTKEELDSKYGTYVYANDQAVSPITIKSYDLLLDEFEPYRVSNKILDIGCGVGFFLEQAKKRGWEVYGSEYSDAAIKICRDKGINMKEGKLDPAQFEGHTFDVITSFEVMEHINNPKEELKHIHALLRSNGLFYLTTPNFNSLLRFYLKEKYNIICYPEHLSYYTKSTLNKVITEQGFKKHKFLSTGISITRLKDSAGKEQEIETLQTSSDEVIRQKIDAKWHLKIIKKIVNGLLTLTNTGITLKGYYVK